MFDNLNSSEKVAAAQLINTLREMYDKDKLSKQISFEEFLIEINKAIKLV